MIIEDYIKISLATEDSTEETAVKDLMAVYKDLPYKDVLKLLEEYRELDKIQPDLINRFKIGGVEFGLIPDFDKMTTGEFLDLSNYEDSVGNIHRLLAILYRPVTSSKGKLYSIEDYEGSDKYKDVMLKVDVSVYLSVISFFLLLNQACMKVLSTSFQKELERQE